ncbi:MAG: hypothetical protein ACXQTW_08030 [Candidatus Methanospirareceae archaeon]
MLDRLLCAGEEVNSCEIAQLMLGDGSPSGNVVARVNLQGIRAELEL